jgi:hypothetical protein
MATGLEILLVFVAAEQEKKGSTELLFSFS